MLAILAMLAPKRALRVAPGCSAPLFPSVVLRGLDMIGPGRESRLASRTGKPGLDQCRLHDGIAFWIEGDGGDLCPVTGLAGPAPWVVGPHLLIERVAGGEHGAILPGMALRRRDVTDAAVAVVMIVPLDEACGPLPGGVEIGEAAGGELRPVFGSAEQRLGIGIVVADPRRE